MIHYISFVYLYFSISFSTSFTFILLRACSQIALFLNRVCCDPIALFQQWVDHCLFRWFWCSCFYLTLKVPINPSSITTFFCFDVMLCFNNEYIKLPPQIGFNGDAFVLLVHRCQWIIQRSRRIKDQMLRSGETSTPQYQISSSWNPGRLSFILGKWRRKERLLRLVRSSVCQQFWSCHRSWSRTFNFTNLWRKLQLAPISAWYH